MREDEHPAPATLRHLVIGTASRGEQRRTIAHLLRGCPTCAEQVRKLFRREIPSGAYDGLFSRLERSTVGSTVVAAEQSPSAQVLLSELDAEPARRQEILVRNSRRFLVPELAQLLVKRSYELRFQDLGGLRHLAHLAVIIADRLWAIESQHSRQTADLRARCYIQLFGALRITNDLAGADSAMEVARSMLNDGTGELALRALFYDRCGTLRKYQCRYQEAYSAYEQAAEIYRELGRPQDLATVLVGEAIVGESSGEYEKSLELLAEALPKLDGSDPRLTLAATHAVVVCQVASGRIDEASLAWLELRPLYDRIGDPLIQLRGQWLEGRLMIAQGVVHAGLKLLEGARAQFLERGLHYDAAVLALHVAEGHLRLGRKDRVQSLLREAQSVFAQLDLDPSVLATFVRLRGVLEASVQSGRRSKE